MRKTAILLAVMLPLWGVTLSAQSRGAGLWADISLSSGNLFLESSLGNGSRTMQQTDYAADAVLGWRLGSRLAIGAGATASCVIKSGACSFPQYLRLRYDILDRAVSPYLNLDMGWSLAARSVLGEDAVQVADEPFYTLDRRYVEFSNPDMYYRKGLMAALTAGVSVRIERGNRLYFGVTAGACQVSHGVEVRNADGSTTNYATPVKGPEIRTVLVPTHEGFWQKVRPEIRFRIGFEL